MEEAVLDHTTITIADSIVDPQEWRAWLDAYAALRTKEFIRLLETRRSANSL